MSSRPRRMFAAALAAVVLAVHALSGAVLARTTPVASATGTQTAVPALLDALDGDQLVVALVHGTDTEAALAAVAAAGLPEVEAFDRFGVVATVGAADAVRSLGDDDRVEKIEVDDDVSYFLDTSHVATRGAEVIAGFDVTTTTEVTTSETTKSGKTKQGKTRQTSVTETTTYAFDGAGISIAILDSGIDGTHPFFQDENGVSKVARNLDLYCDDLLAVASGDGGACEPAWVDSLTNDTDTDSAGGHGTHVAGIAAGYPTQLPDGRTIMGAAPGATLIGLSAGASLSIYGGTSGLNWVLEHHEDPCGDGSCPPIRVVNNSWGSSGADHDPDSLSSQIVNELVAEGVVVAFAMGNDGGDGSDNNASPYALNPTPGVLGVANYDDGNVGTRDGALDDSSSRGQAGRPSTYPDIAAPGANILSSCRIYLTICSSGLDPVDNGDYNTISGTSMATPHIAGIVAQLLEADPTLTPAEIEDVLEDTAHPFATGAPYEYDATNPDTGTSFDKGHGLVDVVEAVTAIVAPDGTAPEPASECVADGPVVVDPAGDATGLLGQETPLENQPALDVLSGTIVEDPDARELRFELRVSDLQETPPDGSLGEYFDWNFTYAGGGFYLGMGWDRTSEPRFLVGRFETTRTTLADIEGTYDVDGDVITGILPYDLLSTALDGAVPVIADGSVLGGHEIVARYDDGVLVPDADTATGSCPYTVGLGAVPPPEPDTTTPDPSPGGLPPGDADAEISASSPSATFVAEPGTAVNEPSVGSVGVTSEPSDTYTIDVIVPEGGSFTVDALADQPEVQDIDLVVFDQSGAEVASSGNPGGAESATVASDHTQRFTIEVIRYATVEAGYTLTVTLD